MLAKKQFKDLLDRREAKGLYSWTFCIYPTAELASHAKLSILSQWKLYQRCQL
jgi:aminopeptidase